MSSIENICNFVQLTPLIGTAGQPRSDQFPLIASAGFQSVINLAMPEHADSIDIEGKLVTQLGMNYFHLPVPFDRPGVEHLELFCDLLRAQGRRKLFIHCIMNYRVSAFMYQYLQRVCGYSTAQARSPIFDKWQVEPQWQTILELTAEELSLD